MVKVICDMCGKETGESYSNNLFAEDNDVLQIKGVILNSKDLCRSCIYEEIKKLMKP